MKTFKELVLEGFRLELKDLVNDVKLFNPDLKIDSRLFQTKLKILIQERRNKTKSIKRKAEFQKMIDDVDKVLQKYKK